MSGELARGYSSGQAEARKRIAFLEAQLAERTRERDEALAGVEKLRDEVRSYAGSAAIRGLNVTDLRAEVQRLQGELEQARKRFLAGTPLHEGIDELLLSEDRLRSRLEEATRLLSSAMSYHVPSGSGTGQRIRAFLRSGDAPERGRDGG